MLVPPFTVTPVAQAALDLAVRSSVWRASELAVSRATTTTTGHPVLDSQLPNEGWPRSALVELLVQQHGIGEMQLLKPALASLSRQHRVALIQPPYLPHAMACRSWRMNEQNVLWLRPQSSADALWSAEQILKNGSCGGVVLWQSNVRPEALRRLNLAAQSTDTWLWLVRPLTAAADASPSPLRLALRPALGGVSVDIIKRRGPHCESPIFVPLIDMPAGRQLWEKEHETPAQRTPATSTARVAAPMLV
ncbi:translesion DNA synthesis-associated protein ImuA [Massilia sp. Root418]|uniref:translesion DNA synthesis-associated protein ImuA n=1 Tax=Massilia sp. Root418 TaxID=1736532 RepID=UPI0009E78D2B|nr:translesion DNA synthesis-associated protein ImuA [Massilia sp. Root418]